LANFISFIQKSKITEKQFQVRNFAEVRNFP